MASLTQMQHEAIEKIRAVRQLNANHFNFVTKPLLVGLDPDARPSEWVNVVQLRRCHSVSMRTIESLAKRGFVELQTSDGSGLEVRVVAKEYV